MSNPYKTIYELRETIAELSERCREQEADIEELLKEREWISVKDKLPDDVKDVIVCDEFGLVYPAYYYTFDGCWMYSFAAERCEHKITHWMPLPTPPESEDDAE